MQKFSLFLMLSVVLVFLSIPGCQNAIPPESTPPPPPDVVAFLNIERGMESDLMKKMKEQPNYNKMMESFAQNFSDNLSSTGGTQFPKELIAILNDGKETSMTGQEAIDKFFDKIIAFQMNVWLIPIKDQPGETPKIEGTITVVTKLTVGDVEESLKQMDSSQYKSLNKEANTALYEFTIRQNSFFIGYTQLAERNALAIVASDKKERVEKQLKDAATKEFEEVNLSATGPFVKFVVLPTFFEKTKSNIIDKILNDTKDIAIVNNLAKILGMVDQCMVTFEDVDNLTVAKIAMSIPNEEDLNKQTRTWQGLFNTLKLLRGGSGAGNIGIPEPVMKAVPFLQKVVVTQEEGSIVLAYTWDDPQIFTVIDELLGQQM